MRPGTLAAAICIALAGSCTKRSEDIPAAMPRGSTAEQSPRAVAIAAPPFDLPHATYVHYRYETEIGRERVTFRADGWSARCPRHAPGFERITHVGELVRQGETLRWALDALTGEDSDQPWVTELDQQADDGSVPATRRLAAMLGEASRELVRRLDDPALERFGIILHDLDATRRRVLRVRDRSQATIRIDDRDVPVWILKLDAETWHTARLVCSTDGMLLRYLEPSRHLELVLDGFPQLRKLEIEGAPEPWRKALSRPEHEVAVDRGLRVRMADGTRLATDVHRPKPDGRYPTIVVRTPYDRQRNGLRWGAFFARRGYALVTQDVRGRHDSGGEWQPFVHEAADGASTVEWAAAQPWSDGAVAVLGASYDGLAAWLAAKAADSKVRAIVPLVAMPDPEHFVFKGGVLSLEAATWLRRLESDERDLREVDKATAFGTLPLADLDAALDIRRDILDTWITRGPRDELWAPARYQHALADIDLPALHVTGWFDGNLAPTLHNFEVMRAKSPAREHQHLIVGPWEHRMYEGDVLHRMRFGDSAYLDLGDWILRFLDRYLRAKDNGIDSEPIVAFQIGRNEWRRHEAWPPPGVTRTRLYLTRDAADDAGAGQLSLEPPEAGSTGFTYDPVPRRCSSHRSAATISTA